MSPNRPAPASIANAKSKQWGHKGRIKRQINMNEWKDKRKTQTKRNTSSNKTTTKNTTEKHQPISRFLQRKQSTTHPCGNKSRPQEHPHQRPPPEPPPGTQGTEATGRRLTPWNEISNIVQTTTDFQLTNPPRARPLPNPHPKELLQDKMRSKNSNKSKRHWKMHLGPEQAQWAHCTMKLQQQEPHNSQQQCQFHQNHHPMQLEQKNKALRTGINTQTKAQKKLFQTTGKRKSPSEEC